MNTGEKMKIKEEIISELKRLSGHPYAALSDRCNTAIEAALAVLPSGSLILIPEEGGWLHYRSYPPKKGLKVVEIKCVDSQIDLKDLEKYLSGKNGTMPAALIYHQPGGYFAEQPAEEIYKLCSKRGCLVIMDACGSLGTKYCSGKWADIIVGSFSKWKPINAGKGGFISARDKKCWNVIGKCNLKAEIIEEKIWRNVLEKIKGLPLRMEKLSELKKEVISELREFEIVRPKEFGLVVIVKFDTEQEKEKIINYCKEKGLGWTECPRYIRTNKKAISIEVKRID
jgi:dTDP-4-amino-4,6-dideoxygalactose transaminase